MRTLSALAKSVVASTAVLAGLHTPGVASAQSAPAYPTKPVHVIINSSAGGLTDVVARLVMLKVGQSLGQPMVLENRLGAGGLVGSEQLVKAAPDGYTLAVVANGLTSGPQLQATPPFDAVRDVQPVSLLLTAPLVLVTSSNSPYTTLAQYIGDAKSSPGKISIASGGSATMGHLLAEQLQAEAGVRLVHVPYKGGAPALNDVIAGHVPMFFDSVSTSTKMIQEGRLRALAIVAEKRQPTLPTVPTIAEVGYGNVRGGSWIALIAPAGTPQAIVNRLNEEVGKVLALPEVKERFASIGGTVEGGSPAVLGDLIKSEVPRWTKLIRERNISSQ